MPAAPSDRPDLSPEEQVARFKAGQAELTAIRREEEQLRRLHEAQDDPWFQLAERAVLALERLTQSPADLMG